MRLPSLILVLASSYSIASCGEKTSTSGTTAAPGPIARKPIAPAALFGKLFRDNDPFEVVSGYATTTAEGAGIVKLFDLTIPPCEKYDQLGRAGRMVQINIPPDAVGFAYDSVEDSEKINGSVVFVEGSKKVVASTAEFMREKQTAKFFIAGLSAYDSAGNYVNGSFKVVRCSGNQGVITDQEGSTATSTAQGTSTDDATSTEVMTATNTATATSTDANSGSATATGAATSTVSETATSTESVQ